MAVAVVPLTYEVDAMRALLVAGGRSLCGIDLDFLVLVATTVALARLACRLYTNLVR